MAAASQPSESRIAQLLRLEAQLPLKSDSQSWRDRLLAELKRTDPKIIVAITKKRRAGWQLLPQDENDVWCTLGKLILAATLLDITFDDPVNDDIRLKVAERTLEGYSAAVYSISSPAHLSGLVRRHLSWTRWEKYVANQLEQVFLLVCTL